MKRHAAYYGYVDYTTDTGEPFYVGKGIWQRVRVVARNQKHTRVREKHGCQRVVEFASSIPQAVTDWEVETIAALGTCDSHLGCNLTLGGEGNLGWKPREETRAKIAAAYSPERKARQAASNRARVWLPETIAYMRTINTGKRATAEIRAKMSASSKARTDRRSDKQRATVARMNRERVWTAEAKAKISAANRRRSPETLARMSIKHFSPEARARISAAQKGRQASAETRAKMSAASKGRPKSAETRARMSAAAKKRKRQDGGRFG